LTEPARGNLTAVAAALLAEEERRSVGIQRFVPFFFFGLRRLFAN
jgi:hypothetical protein